MMSRKCNPKSTVTIYRDYHYDNFHIVPRINPRIPYQPETLVSARGPKARGPKARGLMRESKADTGFEG